MLKQAFSVAGTRIAGTAAQGLTFLILTQTLGPAAFGAFVAITVAYGLVSSLIDLGTGTLALRIQGTENPRALAGSISIYRYIVVIITAMLIGSFCTLFTDLMPALLLSGILFGAVEASYRPIENLLFGFSRTQRAQGAMVMRRFVVLAAVLSGHLWDVTSVALNGTLIALLLISPAWLVGLLAKPLSLASTVHLSLPYWGSALLAKLQTLDVMIASAVVNPIGVGLYAAASRITSPLNILASSILSVLTPELSQQTRAVRQKTYRKIAKFLLYLSCSLILISPLVGWLLERVLGPEYQGVALPAAILCISTSFAALNQGQVSYLYAADMAKKLFLIRLAIVPTTMLSGIPLGLLFGGSGVATAVCISQLVQVVVLRRAVARLQKEPVPM